MKNGNPMVSVVVVSYCSQDTILETLDSIYAQTYPNIELIVSDDCSTDDTVSLVQKWAQSHADRFSAFHLHTKEKNLGVPDNLNAGIRLSSGKYIKDLAADDLLFPDCITQYVTCCEEKGWNNLCARVKPFLEKDGVKVDCAPILLDEAFFEKTPKAQYNDMLIVNRICSPTFFATRELMDQMGLYDSQYRFMEDYPMYTNIAKAGHQLHFLDAYTVRYRISESSLSNAVGGRAIHPGYHKNLRDFFWCERFWGLMKNKKLKRILSEIRTIFCNDLIILLGNDLSRPVVRFLAKLRDSHFSK